MPADMNTTVAGRGRTTSSEKKDTNKENAAYLKRREQVRTAQRYIHHPSITGQQALS